MGIGNPGRRYVNNRHNVGFMFLDYFADSYNTSFSVPSDPSTKEKFDFYASSGKVDENNFILIKPTTYVNNSGIAAKQALEFYSTGIQDLLVVYDDLNLDTAKFKIKISGSDGGHNGISSIIYHLYSDQFPRLRIGIGADFEKGGMAEYVLSDFTEEEFHQLEETFKQTKILTEDFIRGGIKQMLDTNSTFYKPKTNTISKKEKGD